MGQHQPATEGWVYFIEAVGLPRIKIGFTKNFEQRIGDLQGASPIPLKLIKKVRTTYRVEQTLLSLFHPYRVHGEWFDAHPALLAFIKKLADGDTFCLSKIFC